MRKIKGYILIMGIIAFNTNLLGNDYDDGIRAAQSNDFTKAYTLFSKSCDNNSIGGCYQLAGLYLYGMGVSKDYIKALQISEKACNLGNAESCKLVGGMYYHAENGIAKNIEKAIDFISKGCNLRDGEACMQAAQFYVNGDGVKQDLTEAKKFVGKACDANLEIGCKVYSSMR